MTQLQHNETTRFGPICARIPHQPVLDRVVISRRAFLPSDRRPSPAFQTEVKRPGAWQRASRPTAVLTAASSVCCRTRAGRGASLASASRGASVPRCICFLAARRGVRRRWPSSALRSRSTRRNKRCLYGRSMRTSQEQNAGGIRHGRSVTPRRAGA